MHGDAFALFIRHRYAALPRKLLALLISPWLLLRWPFSRALPLRSLVHLGLAGLDEARYRAVMEAFADPLARRPGQFCRDGLQALRRHQAAGDRVIVVTGCEQPAGNAAARPVGAGPGGSAGLRAGAGPPGHARASAQHRACQAAIAGRTRYRALGHSLRRFGVRHPHAQGSGRGGAGQRHAKAVQAGGAGTWAHHYACELALSLKRTPAAACLDRPRRVMPARHVRGSWGRMLAAPISAAAQETTRRQDPYRSVRGQRVPRTTMVLPETSIMRCSSSCLSTRPTISREQPTMRLTS